MGESAAHGVARGLERIKLINMYMEMKGWEKVYEENRKETKVKGSSGETSTTQPTKVGEPSTGNEWQIVKIEGRDYVTAESIRDYYNSAYNFTTFRTQGTEFLLGSSKLVIKSHIGSREMLINKIKFILSSPVVSHSGKILFSRVDVCELIDPVLYPNHIRKAERFDTVVIDAAHGGHDAGARGINGYEKDFALKMAMAVGANCKAHGFHVVYTRTKDEFVTEHERVKIANETDSSIFISLEFNSSTSPATKGIETIVPPHQFAAEDLHRGNAGNGSIALATAVHGSVISRFNFVDCGIKNAKSKVLSGCKHPCIVFKGGFISNEKECQLIESDVYRQQVSAAIGEALINYRKAVESAVHSS